MMLLAAVSQVKCAAATIILMPACQNASATKCCCQPRGLISLAHVPLIITCHYQYWQHLLTRLSVAGGQAVYVCLGYWGFHIHRMYILASEQRPKIDLQSRHKAFSSNIHYDAHVFIYTHWEERKESNTAVFTFTSILNSPICRLQWGQFY